MNNKRLKLSNSTTDLITELDRSLDISESTEVPFRSARDKHISETNLFPIKPPKQQATDIVLKPIKSKSKLKANVHPVRCSSPAKSNIVPIKKLAILTDNPIRDLEPHQIKNVEENHKSSQPYKSKAVINESNISPFRTYNWTEDEIEDDSQTPTKSNPNVNLSATQTPMVKIVKKQRRNKKSKIMTPYNKAKLLQVMNKNSVDRKDKRSTIEYNTNTSNSITRKQVTTSKSRLWKDYELMTGIEISWRSFLRLLDETNVKRTFTLKENNDKLIVCSKCFSFKEQLGVLGLNIQDLENLIKASCIKNYELKYLSNVRNRNKIFSLKKFQTLVLNLLSKRLKRLPKVIEMKSFEPDDDTKNTRDDIKILKLNQVQFILLLYLRLYGTESSKVRKNMPGKIWEESMTRHLYQKTNWYDNLKSLVYPQNASEIVHWADYATSFSLVDQTVGSKCNTQTKWQMYSITTRIMIRDDDQSKYNFSSKWEELDFQQFKNFDNKTIKTRIIEFENSYIAKKPFEVNHSTMINAQFECLEYFKHFKNHIIIEDNANDNKNSERFKLLSSDPQWNKFLPLLIRYSPPNHSAGRVDSQHWLTRQAVQKLIKELVDRDPNYMIPSEDQELVDLLNEKIQKTEFGNTVVYRRFNVLDNEEWNTEEVRIQSNNIGITKSLKGISRAFEVCVKPNEIELIDEYNQNNVYEKFTVEKSTVSSSSSTEEQDGSESYSTEENSFTDEDE